MFGLGPPTRGAALLAGLLSTTTVVNPAAGQIARVAIRGLVLSDEASPLSAALISVDDGTVSVRSDIDGEFEIESVRPGTYVLTFERAGYSTRAFRVAISDTLWGEFDIGPVELTRVDAQMTLVRGVVSHAGTSDPVETVPIALNGEIVAVTDHRGSFQIDSVPRGNNLIEARRIGYVPLTADLEVQENTGVLELVLTLDPLPFRLDDVEVVVEGDKTIYALGRLRDFYRRRRSTPGEFITREDIEKRNPMEVSDMLWTVPGLRITQAGFERRITVRGCTPVIYLDGMPLRGVELDAVVFPEHVQAIEVHRGAFMPVEFMTFGACAAIVIWTR